MASTSCCTHRRLAALALFIGLLVLPANGNHAVDSLGDIIPKPTDQTAEVGELAFFQCQYSLEFFLPSWIINGVEYLPSELPPNHWINSSGLIVRASKEINRTSYECSFNIFLKHSNGVVIVFQTSMQLAYLTVIQSSENTTNLSNYLTGPTITGFSYNSTADSLILSWDKLHPRVSDRYQISFRNCSTLNYTEPATISSSCNETEIIGLKTNSTLLIEVQSCDENGLCGFNLNAASPPNLIAIDFKNTVSNREADIFQLGDILTLNTSSCDGQLIIRTLSSLGTRKDTRVGQTAYLTDTTTADHIDISLSSTYMTDIRSEFGEDTEWVILQEICIAFVCGGDEIAEIFGLRRVITLNVNPIEANSLIAPNCTFLILEPPMSSTLGVMATTSLIAPVTTSATVREVTDTLLSGTGVALTPTQSPQIALDFEAVVAVTSVATALVALVLVFAIVLIMAAVLLRKRKSARTYGISVHEEDNGDFRTSSAYLATQEKSATLRSTPSFTTSNGVRTLSSISGDDDIDETPWGIINTGRGDYV